MDFSSLQDVRGRLSVGAGVLGTIGAVAVWVLAPQGREVQSVGSFLAKLAVFACVILAIALFPSRGPTRPYLLLYVAFVGFAGYIFPRISYFYYFDVTRVEADGFYTHLYMLAYPGMVLTVTAAYRLGGGSAGQCLKIAGTGILIIFSGFLDVTWWLVNPVELPTQIDAPHIMVFTGRPVSFTEAAWFTAAHLPFVVGLNLLPLDRWLDRWLGPDQPPQVSSAPPAAPRRAPVASDVGREGAPERI